MQSLGKFRTPNTNKSMGIEIECIFKKEFDCNYNRLYPEYGVHHGFFYTTTDGSIDCSHRQLGVEFVSQPLPANWLKKEILKLEKRHIKNPWFVNSTCGIHIHVSRKWLSEKKARSINAFLVGLTELDREDLFGRPSNDYCQYGKWGTTRYNAINIENAKTFEFRVFASGNGAWACYCVSMVEYLINNANTLNLDAIYAFRELALPKD
jgi:hypothetical protein